jgi:hypothetical protein
MIFKLKKGDNQIAFFHRFMGGDQPDEMGDWTVSLHKDRDKVNFHCRASSSPIDNLYNKKISIEIRKYMKKKGRLIVFNNR